MQRKSLESKKRGGRTKLDGIHGIKAEAASSGVQSLAKVPQELQEGAPVPGDTRELSQISEVSVKQGRARGRAGPCAPSINPIHPSLGDGIFLSLLVQELIQVPLDGTNPHSRTMSSWRDLPMGGMALPTKLRAWTGELSTCTG